MKKHGVVFPAIFLFLAAIPAFPAAEEPLLQRPETILTAAFSPLDWDLGSPEAIRYGQVALIKKASGNILNVNFLSKEFRSGRKTGVKPEIWNGDYFLVSNFNTPPPHALGGNFGAFQGPPSSAQLDVVTGADGQGSLVLTATREKDGWCGAWVHLIETNAEPLTREFLNGEKFSHLVFWVRGNAPGPDVNVKLADAAWYKKEDSVLVGPIGSYLPSKKIEPTWQLAVVPLASLPGGLDRRTLAVFVIEAISPGPYRLEVKGLALTNNPGAVPAEPPKPKPEPKATWVWNTEQIMSSRAEQSALISHLTQEGINLVYLNLPFKFGAFAFDETEMGGLIMLLQQKGIQTEALFGDKELALPRNHAFVKNAIKDLIGFNSRVAATARFAGVHLDIEPYLLPGFNGPKRTEILTGYLRVLADAAGLARSANLGFGADIPFWLDAVNEYSGDVLMATLDGKAKPVYEHVIEICDQVTLMDYRTSASGVNGTVGQVLGELAYAAKVGKKVYVGLETGPIEDERIFTFRGAPSPDPYAFPTAPFFACVAGAGEDWSITILEPSAAADFQTKQGGAGRAQFWWPVFSAPELPGTAISFAALGLAPLKQTTGLTAAELSVYPSFAGIAVHDFANHRQLVAAQK